MNNSKSFVTYLSILFGPPLHFYLFNIYSVISMNDNSWQHVPYEHCQYVSFCSHAHKSILISFLSHAMLKEVKQIIFSLIHMYTEEEMNICKQKKIY